MKRLFSPWRSKYIASFSEESGRDSCLFCKAANERNDKKNLIVARKKYCFVMMNLFPYNSGHLMVIPYKHTAQIDSLSPQAHAEIMKTVSEMMRALISTLKAQGFNFGANLGRSAGAGIEQHVHFHVVPRWSGDTNFMPVLGEAKVISEAVEETYRRLRQSIKERS